MYQPKLTLTLLLSIFLISGNLLAQEDLTLKTPVSKAEKKLKEKIAFKWTPISSQSEIKRGSNRFDAKEAIEDDGSYIQFFKNGIVELKEGDKIFKGTWKYHSKFTKFIRMEFEDKEDIILSKIKFKGNKMLADRYIIFGETRTTYTR